MLLDGFGLALAAMVVEAAAPCEQYLPELRLPRTKVVSLALATDGAEHVMRLLSGIPQVIHRRGTLYSRGSPTLSS